MPRYFFDTDDGEHLRRDCAGLTLKDQHSAEAEAASFLRDLAHSIKPHGSSVFSCTVREGEERAVYRITMVVEGRVIE